MNVEHLEARVEQLEKIIGEVPLGALAEISPTRENLLHFWKEFENWRVKAILALEHGKLEGI